MNLQLENQITARTCQTSYEYSDASSTLIATSTERCYTPITFFWVLLVIFAIIITGAILIKNHYRNA